ncbi:MAG: SCO family protein [Gaiellaceae bacterium]
MRWVLAVVGGVVAAAMLAAGVVVLASGEERAPEGVQQFIGSVPPAGYSLPELVLRDHRGRPVRLGPSPKGATVLTFLDSQCEDACPVIAHRLAIAWERLTPEEHLLVRMIAISSDPAEDTPAGVERFLRRQGAGRAISYLIGPRGDIRRAWRFFKILASAESGDDELHSAPVRIYDARGEWVSTLHAGVDLTAAALVHDVRAALAPGVAR